MTMGRGVGGVGIVIGMCNSRLFGDACCGAGVGVGMGAGTGVAVAGNDIGFGASATTGEGARDGNTGNTGSASSSSSSTNVLGQPESLLVTSRTVCGPE